MLLQKQKNLLKLAKHLEINNKINIIDLPGYGFAKVSKVMRDNLIILIEEYIQNRESLDHVFLLIDSKVGIKNTDIDMMDFINNCSKNFSLVLTKIDKISSNQREFQKKSILSLMKNYKKTFQNIYLTETKKNNGIYEIQKTIYGLLK